ncbi:GyrI-like domain-containing protein [Paucisalibacillus sp. EB02]|uniref:GyrI-like domain-containing protein n=1 Tax=Paucisalibacillus sp. EB02 TaxID=1347087 RepID=UPI0004B55DB4|nr:GyrI-like domain-containing protein [Paucisalibacillus sp. EB02]
MEISIKKRDAFKAIGVRWQGTFQQAQAGEIKELMQQFRMRLDNLPETINKEFILGVSYDINETGFTYYLCCEVKGQYSLPEDMVEINVPELTYASYYHKPEENISETYTAVYKWIKEEGYRLDDQINLQHLEIYPSDYHPINDAPRLTINIPVKMI